LRVTVLQNSHGVGPIGLAPLGHFPFRLRRWGSPYGPVGAWLLRGEHVVASRGTWSATPEPPKFFPFPVSARRNCDQHIT
jgi:hypothetical protein